MLKFKEFINESHEQVIDIGGTQVQKNLEKINTYLDTLTAKPYQNASVFLTQLRGALELHGILLPQSLTKNFMDLSAELVYALGDSGYYFYAVYDTNDDSFVDAYAQIVDNSELKDLMGMDAEEIVNSNRNPIQLKKSGYIANGYGPGKEDDGGNTNEY